MLIPELTTELLKPESNLTLPKPDVAVLGGTALAASHWLRELGEPSIKDLELARDQNAHATLQWLLRRSGGDISQSFQSDIKPADLPENSQVTQLRDFNTRLVQHVSGMTRQEAVEAATDRSTFVSSIVNSIAESDQYKSRLHYTPRARVENGTPLHDVSFAAMCATPAAVPEMITRIGHIQRGTGQNSSVLQTIRIESSLRHTLENYSVVLKQTEGEEPRLYQRWYHRGQYIEVPYVDPELEQQHFVALMGDVGLAFANHRPEDDVAARTAAERGYII